MIRPREILDLLSGLEEDADASLIAVLATAVAHEGSVSPRAGAMLVVVPGDRAPAAAVRLSELHGELGRELRAVAEGGPARLANFTLREDDPLLGHGIGAPGRTEVWLEPARPALRDLRELVERLGQGRGVVSALEVEGPDAGRRTLLPAEDPAVRDAYRAMSAELVERSSRGVARRTLLVPLHPMGKALLVGSGPDAAALARHLCDLGFTVYVADPRPGALRGPDWDSRRIGLIEGGWEQLRAAAGPDEETSVVVMTHSYALDLETLQGALKSPAPYVGLIGPAARTDKMLAELAVLEVVPRPGSFFAPAGLDLGADAAREVALSVASEILAVRSGRKGGRLLPRRASQVVPHARPRPAGLVLAAGRGRRFVGGHKLSAMIDGKPVLRHVVESALAARLDPVIVVLGCEAEGALRALTGLEDPRLRVVFNPLWEGGKASSIECGLREVPRNAPGVVSLLGDMPRVPSWLIDRVVSEYELSGRLAFPVYPGQDGPRRGYPTAFPRALFGEIRELTGDDTAMSAVRRHWAEAVKIPLDDASTQLDVDTPQDLQLI